MKTQSYFKNPLIIASLAAVMAFAAACGDDDDGGENAPKGGSKNTGGTKSDGGEAPSNGGSKSPTAGKNSGGTSAGGVGNSGNVGGEDNTAAGAGGSGGGAPDCTDEDDLGCYSCKPKSFAQYLNRCPSDGCEPFDNTKLTSIVDGKLPKP